MSTHTSDENDGRTREVRSSNDLPVPPLARTVTSKERLPKLCDDPGCCVSTFNAYCERHQPTPPDYLLDAEIQAQGIEGMTHEIKRLRTKLQEHITSGPRNYVHKQMHAQLMEQKDAEIARLRGSHETFVQQPVAWRVKNGFGQWLLTARQPDAEYVALYEPLYTKPTQKAGES